MPGTRALPVRRHQRRRSCGPLFAGLRERWGGLDYVVHSIAFAPRAAMDGRYIETTREDWLTALEISAYSLVAVAREAEPLLAEGGSLVTLTYYAAEKVVPKYNVMGIAKSALEASVRYLAYELGKKGVRVNAVSAGPVRTVAARSIPGFLKMYNQVAGIAPLGRNVTHEEVGNLGLYLLSPLASRHHRRDRLRRRRLPRDGHGAGRGVAGSAGPDPRRRQRHAVLAAVAPAPPQAAPGPRRGTQPAARDPGAPAPAVPPESVWVATTRILGGEVRRELPEVPAGAGPGRAGGAQHRPGHRLGGALHARGGPARVVAVLPADHRMADAGAFRDALARAARRGRGAGRPGDDPGRGAPLGRDRLRLPGAGARTWGTACGGSGASSRSPRRRRPRPSWPPATISGTPASSSSAARRCSPTSPASSRRWRAGSSAIAADPAALDEVYPRLPAKSIDYAVMEKLDGWRRSPPSLWTAAGATWAPGRPWPRCCRGTPQGNAVRGDVLAVEAGGNLLFAEAGTVAVLGVRDLAVVRTDDAVLVLPQERSQEVRRIIDELAGRGRDDLL